MQEKDDILNLLKAKGAEAARGAVRGIILQPGAIGDCILTLPLAELMKERLGLGGVYILGHTEYIGIFPSRTCVDGVLSIDSVDLHQLFTKADTFNPADGDPLINTFADYAWIATFLGEPDSDFEQNLIFTANCSRSAEVITLSMEPPKEFSAHITDFYAQQFIAQSGLSLEPQTAQKDKSLIKATKADINRGKELLEEMDIDFSAKLAVIQPGSGGLNKCCHLDNFLAVAEALAAKDIKVIFLLGPAELERFSDTAVKQITKTAKCLTDPSLADVLGLLSCADSFLGNDSGITHLAAAMGVKTVAVFGPTNPNLYQPIGPAVTVITSSATDFAKKPSPSLQKKLLGALTA
jgi:heptosyltransferase-3